MIRIQQVSKNFGSFKALNQVSLDIATGELVALLGPSGSGKTTLLRIIAGLEFADEGTISFDGVNATDLPVRDREVGFVFQHYALFRHMTVAENIGFGLRVRPRSLRPPRRDIEQKVNELLKLVQLDALGGRYPNQLSGGQRQRVALARALAVDPKFLLLDEPFGALDARVRKELRRWLRRLHSEIKITGIFVTHDQEEALEVADRVVVMSQGKIERVGTPSEIYDRPVTPFVYQFLGNVNRLECVVRDDVLEIGDLKGQNPRHRMSLPLPDGAPSKGNGIVFLRPYDLIFAEENDLGLDVVIRHQIVLGQKVCLETDCGNVTLEMEIDRRLYARYNMSPGETVRLSFRTAHLFIGDWQGELSLTMA